MPFEMRSVPIRKERRLGRERPCLHDAGGECSRGLWSRTHVNDSGQSAVGVVGVSCDLPRSPGAMAAVRSGRASSSMSCGAALQFRLKSLCGLSAVPCRDFRVHVELQGRSAWRRCRRGGASRRALVELQVLAGEVRVSAEFDAVHVFDGFDHVPRVRVAGRLCFDDQLRMKA